MSRSGYYEWLNRVESLRSKKDRRLLVAIKALYHESRETYGALRVHEGLIKKEYSCGKNRVARLMHKAGLKSVYRRKYRPMTTQSDHNERISANIVNQDFRVEEPNVKWGSDISYIETKEGWLYLAIVMDFYSRKVIGYSMGSNLQAELCCEALRRACLLRQPAVNLIHHSDRGVQYASGAYRELLAKHGLRQSMSRKGNCYDNAMVESFFGTLKVERVHRVKYLSREEAKKDISDYISNFYNKKRMHSSLGYQSPVEYESSHKIPS